MKSFRQRAAEGLREGDRFTFTPPSPTRTFAISRGFPATITRCTATTATWHCAATAEICVTNTEGVTVLEARTRGVLPGKAERQRLAEMLAEGDPTNGVMNANT